MKYSLIRGNFEGMPYTPSSVLLLQISFHKSSIWLPNVSISFDVIYCSVNLLIFVFTKEFSLFKSASLLKQADCISKTALFKSRLNDVVTTLLTSSLYSSKV